MTATIEILRAGPMVTIQDGGRAGWLRYGIPASGPVDRWSHAVAAVACGRDTDAVGVEVSAGGLSFRADRAITIGLAAARVELAGSPLPWSEGVATVPAGVVASVMPADGRRWASLVVAGDLRVETWLGSASTHVGSGLGGGVVRTGDRWPVAGTVLRSELDGPVDVAPADRDVAIRVVLGPQDRHFTAAAVGLLASASFDVTPRGDRMGVRLDGPALDVDDALAIPSEPVVRGAIQVAGDGVPTVLLADHQPTGGYPKIATVISTDVDVLAQRPAGAEVVFEVVSPAEAIEIVRAECARRSEVLTRLGAPDRTLSQRLFGRNLISTPESLG